MSYNLPLSYLIGADFEDIEPDNLRVIEVPYDDRKVGSGQNIAYCNLFHENRRTEGPIYAPYLPADDTSGEYNEGRIDPRGDGWRRNLDRQYSLRRKQGFDTIELDNPDSYDGYFDYVMAEVENSGFKIAAKNPGLLSDDNALRYVSHPNVIAIIVERGAGTARQMDDLRRVCGKAELPVWFVAFDEVGSAGENWADRIADEITNGHYTNMGVTYSAGDEYVTAEDVYLYQSSSSPSNPEEPEGERNMKIVISSGHGKYIRGAAGPPPWGLDEVDEARKVVNRVAELLEEMEVGVEVFHDDVSTTQNENLNRIVNYHNAQERDLDVSVHFNAYQSTSGPMGCEVLYVSSGGLEVATDTVNAICEASDLTNRGPKKRTDLFFLNNTEEVAVLIETCFVDSQADASIYHDKFEEICQAIAETISGQEVQRPPEPGEPEEPEPPIPPMPDSDVERIKEIANSSAIARYSWDDRGEAPTGYTQGFALTWATVVRKFLGGNPAAVEMAKANTGDDDVDAISWYNSNFAAIGMRNDVAGIDTLRHLFVLLMGLGMRESSGQHCEGRDMSADNVTADTAEAGLYQTSYNAHSCHDQFDVVMNDYENNVYPGYMDEFSEDVSCDSSSWANYGSGTGEQFQDMCKKKPAFAVESCALVLRNLRQHYGPINRKEAELRVEADQMLLEVQQYIQGTVEPTLEQRVAYLEIKVTALDARVTKLEAGGTKATTAVTSARTKAKSKSASAKRKR